MWWLFFGESLKGFTAFSEEFSFSIDQRGSQNFKWNGLKLHFQKGALSAECTGGCKVDAKTGLAGQFQFPGFSELVSCIYWLSCQQKFLKPVTLQIQHCVSVEGSSHLRFVVAKSSHSELP